MLLLVFLVCSIFTLPNQLDERGIFNKKTKGSFQRLSHQQKSRDIKLAKRIHLDTEKLKKNYTSRNLSQIINQKRGHFVVNKDSSDLNGKINPTVVKTRYKNMFSRKSHLFRYETKSVQSKKESIDKKAHLL